MELATQSDIYAPSINDIGNYIDKIPSSFAFKNGMYCPCGSRKDKVYETYAKFSSHIKTKTHRKWLEDLNINKSNFYIEALKQKETISNQKLIIAKMELEMLNKDKTINYLTNQLNTNTNTKIKNLIDL